jgi:hypothetical protein
VVAFVSLSVASAVRRRHECATLVTAGAPTRTRDDADLARTPEADAQPISFAWTMTEARR